MTESLLRAWEKSWHLLNAMAPLDYALYTCVEALDSLSCGVAPSNCLLRLNGDKAVDVKRCSKVLTKHTCWVQRSTCRQEKPQ